MKRIAYKGWKNCLRLANKQIELIVTGDVGPRVIHMGLPGGQNEFYADPKALGKTGGNAWRLYGGHRLWHAPEIQPRTYAPDNDPIEFERHPGFVRTIQPVEKTTGIQKELDFALDPKRPLVRITHRLTNKNSWAIELAPWALSVMASGGTCIFPLPERIPFPKRLLPHNHLTLWSYVDMADPRWTWGRRYILLRQDQGAKEPQKIGSSVHDGWAAYANGGRLFVKFFDWCPGAQYPDFGCNFETYTNKDMLEVETLGPLTKLEPGASVEHTERWALFKGVPEPRSDDDVEKHVAPKVREARKFFR